MAARAELRTPASATSRHVIKQAILQMLPGYTGKNEILSLSSFNNLFKNKLRSKTKYAYYRQKKSRYCCVFLSHVKQEQILK